jgi:hypothetical protein
MKFENHKNCQVLMMSYVEVVVKNENILNTSTHTLFRNWNISKDISKNLN